MRMKNYRWVVAIWTERMKGGERVRSIESVYKKRRTKEEIKVYMNEKEELTHERHSWQGSAWL